MFVGLTGGISCGKSTVSQMFVSKGCVLVDSDQLAREVVNPGSPALEEIATYFGQEVLTAKGELHREKLGEIIFGNHEARKKLESIIHPKIRTRTQQQIMQFEEENPSRLTIVDVPLLYEVHMENMFPEVIVVYCPQTMQIDRLMERDNLSHEQATQRIQAQMPIEEKRKKADVLIDNSKTLEHTMEQVELLLNDDDWKRSIMEKSSLILQK
ncbi:dephospho-CoA kinase [Longirhabdus pacifica]|uniref:dephospho-CoA kinase n=1 Tax=Longirhabdus pacifica TaxID=2305227 RepID=UPI001008D6DB|nr:dephospho-CoA kinase [Longirhabdus pacifica]